ncbi:hypothetical protein ACFL6S_09270 [Candidatus Poribacteria bacterium]
MRTEDWYIIYRCLSGDSAAFEIDWDNPQFSYHFKLIHSLRTKIERLFARMKERFKMRRVYKRGVDNIWGHVLKFINLLRILANVTGSYGV